MTSCQPYIIRAVYQWIIDNKMTPFITINSAYLSPKINSTSTKDETQSFNISKDTVKDLIIDDKGLSFKMLTDKTESTTEVPIESIISIYAKEENGSTVVLASPQKMSLLPSKDAPEAKGKPDLRIVK